MGKRFWYLALVFVLVALAACGGDDDDIGGDTSDADVDPEATLVIGDNLTGSGFSQRLQPDLSTSVCDFHFMNPVFSTLAVLDPTTGEVEPGLAESWEIVDAKTVEFTLRPDLTFHDGTKLDANAAKAGLEKNMAGRLGSTMSFIESISVQDPRTFTLKLKTTSAAIVPVTLAGREGHISAASSTDTAPVGAGPFKFVRQTVGQEMEYVKYDGYWDADSVQVAGVKVLNTGVRSLDGLNALQAGEVDAVAVGNPAELTPIEGDPDIEVEQRPSLSYHKINVNTSKGPWANLKFRQAMNHAVDREAVGNVLFGEGNHELAWMPFPSFFELAYVEDLAESYPFDQDKARQLIREAGLTPPIRTTGMFPAGSPLYAQFSEIVQAQLKQVGVELELIPSTDMVREFLTEHQTDIAFLLWPPRPDPTVTIFRQFGEKQLNNTGNFTDPKLTKAITDMQSATDTEDQRDAFVDANEVVVENALEIAIAFPLSNWPHRDYVVGDFKFYESCQGLDWTSVAVTTDKG